MNAEPAGRTADLPERPAGFLDLKQYTTKKRLNHVLHVSQAYGYVYVSNPKAACSTIKLYLSRAEAADPEFTPHNVHVRREIPLLRPKTLDKEERQGLFDGRYFVFTFVRHPIKRVVSAYSDKIVGNKPQKREILQILGLDPERLDQTVSFAAFVEALGKTPPEDLNPHWRPQVYNVFWNMVDYDFVGRVESFDDDLEAVRRRLGLPDYSSERRNAKSARLDRGEAVTPALERDLAYLFAWDFEAFGYVPDSAQARAVVASETRYDVWNWRHRRLPARARRPLGFARWWLGRAWRRRVRRPEPRPAA